MDPTTDSIRRDWDRQAGGWYDQREALLAATLPVHEWLVEHLEPKEGQRILEIAAGPGDTGFLAAPRLGKGRLLSTDISEEMVEAARRRSAELGLTGVEHRVLDAQAMDLEDGSFDGVICRWGFMLMPDPLAALRECRRVLAPGGRLVFAVFTGPDENPFASLPARALREAGHLPPPGPGWQPGILALADRAGLQSLLHDAGFTSTKLETVDMTWTFASAEAYWHFVVELTAMGPLVASLPDAARTALRTVLDERVARFSGPRGLALPSRCWCGTAAG
jgi:SAM-dependent methyltransferase